MPGERDRRRSDTASPRAGDVAVPRAAATRLRARGVVQGVGFRPFIYSLARRHGLAGWVRNTSAGVEIHVEGPEGEVESFVAALPDEAPPRAHIAVLTRSDAELEGADAFLILESAVDPAEYQLVSPDIATCDDCRRELRDPRDRRFQYPFTNCTNCGPRLTIIEDLPYDRERTTMRRFPMCPSCRREYEDPLDRRFHAEPTACPVCGPRVELLGRDGGGGLEVLATGTPGDPSGPIREAAALLRGGGIVAVQGLGGFHLACDATDGDAVRRLKRRKRRPHKPLAVMLSDVDELRRHCRVTPAEQAVLTSPEHPIVLLEWRDKEAVAGLPPAPVDPDVAVGQRYLGVMLPYTPLHILLLDECARPLVMTSGNLAEEPMVKDREEIGRLDAIADAYLVHDRPIAERCDDSVVQVAGERPRLVRRARGYAPFPVPLPRPLPPVLACGAELKNTFCLTRDANAFLSHHIGDLENLETLESYEEGIRDYRRLFRIDPEVVAFDLHPEYLATKHALTLPGEKVAVQHHHAHVAAAMVEAGLEDPVIGVSMDGLGYGDDGVLWGGEVLVCGLEGYRRAAHLEELPLPGGALAIRRPWRTALGWSLAALGPSGLQRALALLGRVAPSGEAPPGEEAVAALVRQVETRTNAPLTTSCGRLFDAVSALAGVRSEISYEGQAAIELEMRSRAGAPPYEWVLDGDPGEAAAAARLPVAGHLEENAGGSGVRAAAVRLAPLLEGVLADLEAGAPPELVGGRLHATLAALVTDVCRRVRAATGLTAVALTGGVFQNRLLASMCEDAVREAGFRVIGVGLVPVNDGGISLGQAAVAGYTVLGRAGRL
jgi:hydrogenase maturation protein HypF